ncbi:MAG: hypothetical protein QM535_21755, partial [Limnohabitans sp.]|nr:hypothetical protein [Limnohabitans sp.]
VKLSNEKVKLSNEKVKLSNEKVKLSRFEVKFSLKNFYRNYNKKNLAVKMVGFFRVFNHIGT